MSRRRLGYPGLGGRIPWLKGKQWLPQGPLSRAGSERRLTGALERFAVIVSAILGGHPVVGTRDFGRVCEVHTSSSPKGPNREDSGIEPTVLQV